jgi:hypothetical protein
MVNKGSLRAALFLLAVEFAQLELKMSSLSVTSFTTTQGLFC